MTSPDLKRQRRFAAAHQDPIDPLPVEQLPVQDPPVQDPAELKETTVLPSQPDIVPEPDESASRSVAPTSPAGAQWRLWLLGIGGAIALVAGTVVGVRWWQFQQTHLSTDNAEIEGHASPIAAQVAATVRQVLVKPGEAVQAGQPLIVLDDRDLGLKVEQAEAQLAIAQAQWRSASDTINLTSQTNTTQVQQSQAKLAASQAAITAAQTVVNQAQATIAADQAKLAQARTEANRTAADFHRYAALFQEGAIAAQQYDAAKAADENAQAMVSAADRAVDQDRAAWQTTQAQLEKVRSEAEAAGGQVAETKVSRQKVTVQQDQQQLAQAQVKQAQAELALARQQLAYSVIKAPVSGYVGELTAQVGQQVGVGQALMSLVPLQANQVYIQANFKETTVGKLRLGQRAIVQVDAYPDETFQAAIAGISPTTGAKSALIPPDNATGNFNRVVQWVPVRLELAPNQDPKHQLRPGLSVTVAVDTTSGSVPLSGHP